MSLFFSVYRSVILVTVGMKRFKIYQSSRQNFEKVRRSQLLSRVVDKKTKKKEKRRLY